MLEKSPSWKDGVKGVMQGRRAIVKRSLYMVICYRLQVTKYRQKKSKAYGEGVDPPFLVVVNGQRGIFHLLDHVNTCSRTQ